MISFACALTSILALQTAMLVQFGEQDKSFMMLMNSLIGGAVCFSVFVMAIWLVHKTRKEMRIIMEMKDEYENAAQNG